MKNIKTLGIIVPIAILLFSSCKKDEVKDKAYTNTSLSSGVINFTGGCNYSVEYINSTFEIKFDNQLKNVLSSGISTTMVESVNGFCSQPAYPTNNHSYFLDTFSINGDSLTINFNQDVSSFPQNDASFKGTINGSTINGILKFDRTSNGITCIVNIPFTLTNIN